MNCVPLISASPSLGPSETGASPYSSSTTRAGFFSPRCQTSPSPISGRKRWAKGARSPEAPTDPFSGTTGIMFSARCHNIRSSVANCTPEYPCARACTLVISMIRPISDRDRIPHPHTMALEDFMLQQPCIRLRDLRVGQNAKTCVDPIDRSRLPNDIRNLLLAGPDLLNGSRRQHPAHGSVRNCKYVSDRSTHPDHTQNLSDPYVPFLFKSTGFPEILHFSSRRRNSCRRRLATSISLPSSRTTYPPRPL